MQIFKYQPYYGFNGPDKSDPFRERLTSEEAERRVELFFDEIRLYFSDIEATFDRDGLNNLDLFANKLAP